jgi:hypothetical protein
LTQLALEIVEAHRRVDVIGIVLLQQQLEARQLLRSPKELPLRLLYGLHVAET